MSDFAKDSVKELKFHDLLYTLLENWKKIVAITIVVMCLGLLKIVTTTPIYKVDALIQVEERGSGSKNAFGDLASMFEVASPAEAEIELLKSRLVLGQAIQDLGLDIVVKPKLFPLVGQAIVRRNKKSLSPVKPWFGLESYAWGGEQVEISKMIVPRALKGMAFNVTTISDSTFSVTDNTQSLIFNCTVGLDCIQVVGADTVVINVSKLIARPQTKFSFKREQELKVIGGLRNKLKASEKGKQTGMIRLSYQHSDPEKGAEILNRVAEFYIRQNIDRKSEEAAKTLEFLQTQLPLLKETLEISENKLNKYRLKIGSVNLTQEASQVLDQSVALEHEMLELEQKRNDLLRLYEKKHSSVVTLHQQITGLKKRIKGLNDRVHSLPQSQQDILRLSRDVEVNNELYTVMLNNSQQLQMLKAGRIGNVRVVDWAQPTIYPIKPNKSLMLVLFTFLGLLLGTGTAMFLKLLQSGVEDPGVVETKINLPVFASIPHSEKQEELYKQLKSNKLGHHVLAAVGDDDITVESFRSLRTTLHFNMQQAVNNIIMIAGPSPGIGKSFVSTNFAATLAQSSSNVLIVDADMRKGHIHQYFGNERGLGLSELLNGIATADDVIRKSQIPNLSYISTGLLVSNSSELLMNDNFKHLLEHANKAYDYIIIDAPPVLALTDSVIIGQHAGTTLMLLKYGKHPLGEIKASKKRLEQAGVTLKGALFNDMYMEKGFKGKLNSKYSQYTYNYSYRMDKN